MEQREFEHWQAVTSGSRHMWVEDAVTRRNGYSRLYYSGGESGIYMRIDPGGRLQIGNYEGAVPHIGEALFKPGMEKECGSFNEAFRIVCEMGGQKFLADIFSNSQVSQETEIGSMAHRSISF